MMIDLTYGGKSPLTVNNPVLLASGVAGYDGGPYSGVIDLSKLGAIVTNPLTWRPRHAANGPRVVPLPAGVLVHTGLPNPGVRRAIKLYRARWARSLAPVIAHVVATTVEDVAASVAELDGARRSPESSLACTTARRPATSSSFSAPRKMPRCSR